MKTNHLLCGSLACLLIVLLGSCRNAPDIRPLENELLLSHTWRIDSLSWQMWEKSEQTDKQRILIQNTDYQFLPASLGPAKLRQHYYDFDSQTMLFRESNHEEIRLDFFADGKLHISFAHGDQRSLHACITDLTLKSEWQWKESNRLILLAEGITEAYRVQGNFHSYIEEYELTEFNAGKMVLEARLLHDSDRRESIVKIDLSPVICENNNGSESWTARASIPESIDNAFSASANEKVYLITGSQLENALQSVWEYDPLSDSWEAKSPLPGEGRIRTAGFSLGDKIALGTGVIPDKLDFAKDFWLYDAGEDNWSAMADLPADGRRQAVGFAIGNQGYIGTGFTYFGDFRKDFWRYDSQNNSWTAIPDLPGEARGEAVAFAMGDFAYVGLGLGAQSGYLTDFWRYDPQNEQWTRLADFPGRGRGLAKTIILEDKAYVFGGLEAGVEQYDEVWQYDPATDSWTQASTYPGDSRYNLIGGAVGDKIYVGGYGMEFYAYQP